MGFFVDLGIPFEVVKDRANLLWGKFGLLETRNKGNGMFLCIFSCDKEVNDTLESGPWYILRPL